MLDDTYPRILGITWAMRLDGPPWVGLQWYLPPGFAKLLRERHA